MALVASLPSPESLARCTTSEKLDSTGDGARELSRLGFDTRKREFLFLRNGGLTPCFTHSGLLDRSRLPLGGSRPCAIEQHPFPGQRPTAQTWPGLLSASHSPCLGRLPLDDPPPTAQLADLSGHRALQDQGSALWAAASHWPTARRLQRCRCLGRVVHLALLTPRSIGCGARWESGESTLRWAGTRQCLH
jgi:hypothetical protein